MPKRLTAAVHLDHPTTRERILLLPGDEPPADLAELITHPHAWHPDDDPDDDADPDEDEESADKPARTRKARTDTE